MNPADYERIFEVFRAALERPAAGSRTDRVEPGGASTSGSPRIR